MKERQILVLTDACRMAPAAYRDSFVGAYAILDSTKYPAVDPLYWNGQLNQSAHAHALDMGDTCGILQHNSCNGTAWDARIRSYYTAGFAFGENIAAGNTDPFVTMNQWLMDSPQGSTQPAADFSWCKISGSSDSTRCDGHRGNIMGAQYKEIGIGFAYGSSSAAKYHPFWVQDFGGGKSSFTNPIIAAAHFLRESGTITFLVNYFDPAEKAPAEASLFLDGNKIGLTLSMGKQWRGTYQAVVSRGNVCRTYWVTFLDGSAASRRYPEQGALVTVGEGSCTREYVPPESLSVVTASSAPFIDNRFKVSRVHGRLVVFLGSSHENIPQTTSLFDCSGKLVCSHAWPSSGFNQSGRDRSMRFLLPPTVLPGIYLFLHSFNDGRRSTEKIGIIR